MTAAQEKEKNVGAQKKIINDFSMTIATKNGSGSQTSNLAILRSIFRMGIPVSGKNLFPSNIQGLPTWYTIRVSKDGYIARRDTHEIVIAMNPITFAEDLAKVESGGVFLYADDIKQEITREDVHVYPVPAKKLSKDSGAPASLRPYVANMVYVGVLAQILGIDFEKIKQALEFHFGGKEKPIALNYDVIEAAAKWTAENGKKTDPFFLEELDLTDGFIMADGSTAGALGSIYGGAQFCAWYPITPASTLPESLIKYIPTLRDLDSEDKKTYAIVQAEDELAAIGMTIGAGWSGLRAMTSTSGPGISLMSEYIGLAYYSEVPVVIWNVVRVGPSTGLPTRTSQGDLTMTYYLGHGDTQHVIILPSSAHESFEFGWRSLDIAERLQTPVFVITDLDLGMNQWMTKPFEYPDKEMDRGKVLWEEDIENIKERWGRYKDVDKDGIPYRTIPGNRNPKAPYFARGTGHDEYAGYSEDPIEWENNMARLLLKFKTAPQYLPEPIYREVKNAKVGFIAYGSTEAAVMEAQDMLEKEGLPGNFMRIRALPFHDEVRDFIEKHERVYIIELNRDGQMDQIMKTEFHDLSSKFVSLTKHDGLALTAKWVVDAVLAKENN